MHIRAGQYHSAGGLTTGWVTGIHITLSTSPGATRCTGTIDGTGPDADNGKVPSPTPTAAEILLSPRMAPA